MKEYMTIEEAAEKRGVVTRRVNTLCHEGRIDDVAKFGASFAIPSKAKKRLIKESKPENITRKKTMTEVNPHEWK